MRTFTLPPTCAARPQHNDVSHNGCVVRRRNQATDGERVQHSGTVPFKAGQPTEGGVVFCVCLLLEERNTVTNRLIANGERSFEGRSFDGSFLPWCSFRGQCFFSSSHSEELTQHSAEAWNTFRQSSNARSTKFSATSSVTV